MMGMGTNLTELCNTAGLLKLALPAAATAATAVIAGPAAQAASQTAGWLAANWLCTTTSLTALLIAARMRRMMRLQTAERWRERRMREELEAYARLDPSLAQSLGTGMDPARAGRELALRVCRTVADKSAFTRVAMLLRDAEGRLTLVGSVGVDDRTKAALDGWADDVLAEELGLRPRSEEDAEAAASPGLAGINPDRRLHVAKEMRISRERLRSGAPSFAIPLGAWSQFDPEVATWALTGKRERRRWRRALVAPFRTTSGRVLGALVVCADGQMVDGGAGTKGAQAANKTGTERAMSSIEALAMKVARTMENEALAERLLRAEKLAGLGQLAGGVAHALNNPLTAVLGFAELIAESSDELRVRKDAATIVQEALKMRDTVERLIDFWRPGQVEDAAVDLVEICDELASACREKTAQSGVSAWRSPPPPARRLSAAAMTACAR